MKTANDSKCAVCQQFAENVKHLKARCPSSSQESVYRVSRKSTAIGKLYLAKYEKNIKGEKLLQMFFQSPVL